MSSRRADPRRRPAGPRSSRPPGSTSTSPRSPTRCPKDIGRANEPIGRWGRQYGSDPEAVSRVGDGVPRGDARGRRRGHRQALPRAGADPQQHRLLVDRHHRRRRDRRRPLPPAVRRRHQGRRRAGHDGVGALPQARRREPGDVLGDDRHGPAARATGLRGRRHHRRRQRQGAGGRPGPGDRAVRVIAAGGDIVLTGAASDADEMLEALDGRGGRRTPRSPPRSTRRSSGCSPSRSGWACCPAPPTDDPTTHRPSLRDVRQHPPHDRL